MRDSRNCVCFCEFRVGIILALITGMTHGINAMPGAARRAGHTNGYGSRLLGSTVTRLHGYTIHERFNEDEKGRNDNVTETYAWRSAGPGEQVRGGEPEVSRGADRRPEGHDRASAQRAPGRHQGGCGC